MQVIFVQILSLLILFPIYCLMTISIYWIIKVFIISIVQMFNINNYKKEEEE